MVEMRGAAMRILVLLCDVLLGVKMKMRMKNSI
jgi:hypothetical protein